MKRKATKREKVRGGEEVGLCQLWFCLLLTAIVDWIESVSGKSLRMSLPQRFRWDVQGGV